LKLSELDWKTRSNDSPLGAHWRFTACVVIGMIVATLVLWRVFPYTHGFMKLWMGVTIGTFAGGLFGAFWQLRDPARIPRTSGRLLASSIVGAGMFAAVAVFFLAPLMRVQERELATVHALRADDIAVLRIEPVAGTAPRVVGAEGIAAFARLAAAGELYYPSHEICDTRFILHFVFKSGEESSRSACVPERHPRDLVLGRGQAEVLLPHAAAWAETAASADLP
jgi:hypothetical protein